MKFTFTSEARARSLATQLKKFLAREGAKVGNARAQHLIAVAAGYRTWRELKDDVSPSNPSPDDATAGDGVAARRRQFQVEAFAWSGLDRNLAERLTAFLDMSGPFREPTDDQFDERDADFHNQGLPPKWRDPENHPRPTPIDFVEASGSQVFVGHRDGGHGPTLLTRAEVEARIAGKELPSSESPARSHDERSYEEERAEFRRQLAEALKSKDSDIFDFMASRGTFGTVTSPKGRKGLDLPPSTRQAANRAALEMAANLLRNGKASQWEVRSVRKTRRSENGNWQAAPGRILADIILPNDGESDIAVKAALTAHSVLTAGEMLDLDVVVTSTGIFMVDKDSREPVRMLKRRTS